VNPSSPAGSEDVIDLVDALIEEHVDFLLVGAHALAAHGIVRGTSDVDLFVRASQDNAARVFEALRRFGARLSQHGVSEDDFTRGGVVYQLGLPPNRIDLLTQISGVSFADAIRDAVYVPFHGRAVAIPSRDTLITNKLASGRPKDLEDVERLRTLR
jgi:hypothetical protein